MKNLKIICLTLLVATITSCAKQRPVETRKDPEQTWMLKELLTGSGKGKSWLYNVTAIKTSSNNGFARAGQTAFFPTVKLGHFEITKDKLRLLNDVGVMAPSERYSKVLLNEWDISHHDVRLAESDGKVTNKEEEDTTVKTWDKKRYFTIDFATSNISEASSLPSLGISAQFDCFNKKSSSVVDGSLEITEDYLTWEVDASYEQNPECLSQIRRVKNLDLTYTVRYKYSFMKDVKSSYVPYVYKGIDDPLNSRFGYFQTKLESINPKTDDVKVTFLMNRWDPSKTHHYYFAKDFPEEFKWMFNDPIKGIFARTNALFAENKLPTRFEIHENTWGDGKVKELGDIRYSFINLVADEGATAITGGLLGYGPSAAHPLTGEILSATTNIWSGIIKYLISRMAVELSRDPEKFRESSIVKTMVETDGIPQDPEKWGRSFDLSKGAGGAYYKLLLDPANTYGYRPWAELSRDTTKTTVEKIYSTDTEDRIEGLMKKAWSVPGLSLNVNNFIRETTRLGAENESKLLELKNSMSCKPYLEVLSSAVEPLSNGVSPKKIVESIIYRTSEHEFGHNLNLRHNFRGSNDALNFYPPVEVKDENGKSVLDEKGKKVFAKPATASVMDYIPEADEIDYHNDWDPYDKAALLFAYSDGKINPEKKFLYCTDEHIQMQPTCKQHDSGTTLSEIMLSRIKGYVGYYKLRNFRFISDYLDDSEYAIGRNSFMRSIKQFLAYWQNGLGEEKIKRLLTSQLYGYSTEDASSYTETIVSDFRYTQLLAISFFNAVLQQSSAGMNWRSEYHPFSSELIRIGILADKIFAMRYLMGNDTIVYDLNNRKPYISYLMVGDAPELKTELNKIIENAVTLRRDMDPWFLDFARALFADAAKDFYNEDNFSLIQRIKFSRFTAKEMSENFGMQFGERDKGKNTPILSLDPNKPAVNWDALLKEAEENNNKSQFATSELDFYTGPIFNSSHPYYENGLNVGIVYNPNDDYFYMTSEIHNPYAYTIVEAVKDNVNGTATTGAERQEIVNLYNLFNAANNQ